MVPERETAARRRASSASRSGGGRPALRLIRSDQPAARRHPAKVHRLDLVLLLSSSGFLTATGLVMVLSAGSVSAAQGYEGNSFWYFQRQVIYAAVGITAAVMTARMPIRYWKAISVPMLAITAVLMLIAAHPGSGTAFYGASRWIDLGPVTLQPSEFAKLGLVAFTATILSARWGKLDDVRQLLFPLAPVVLAVATLGVLQRDLGTTVILCGAVFLTLFVAGVRLRYLLVAAVAMLAGGAYLIVGEAYRRTRLLDAWVDPWADPQGSGYQLIQGLIALGSGGWFGTGLGTGRAKWDFLPNAHSDFIFAVIGEELGTVGALVVLAAFGVLIYAGIRIAIHATGIFERLLAAGIIAWIGLQAIINMGAVTGLLPITGIPLPLVSFGGTALVVTLAAVGVLAGVARASAGTGKGASPRTRARSGAGTGSRREPARSRKASR